VIRLLNYFSEGEFRHLKTQHHPADFQVLVGRFSAHLRKAKLPDKSVFQALNK
jgi:hypothetical protein